MKYVFEIHKEQVRNSWVPYIFYNFYVAEKMDDENSTTFFYN